MLRSALFAALLSFTAATAWAGPHRLGGGLHYLHSLGDIKETGAGNLDLDEDSFGIIGSYQYDTPGLFKLEADVEYIPDFLGTDEDLIEPSAWLLLGDFIYGGGGIGIGHFNDDWMNDPWYALRAGVDIPLGGLGLDLYGSYRFQDAGDLEDAIDNLDTVTFAAILRFGLGGGGTE
jgi:hypothetical protein